MQLCLEPDPTTKQLYFYPLKSLGIVMNRTLGFAVVSLLTANPALALWQLQSALAPEQMQRLSPAAISAVLISAPDAQQLATNEFIDVPLPGAKFLHLQRERIEQRAERNGLASAIGWFGKVAGEEESTVVLTHTGAADSGALAGYINSKAGVFEITPSAQGVVLMQLDSARFPSCGGAIPALATGAPAHVAADVVASKQDAPADLPSEIDVLLVFRPGSVTQIGSQAAAQTFAQNAVNVSNQSFTNSQMIARFRLAGVRFTSEVELGTASAELNWVSANAQVATWRSEVKADLVSVIAEFSDACGVGYLMNQLGTGFANSAFQATARSCAVGNLSFPHEHGHNMGLMHDPGNGNNGLFAYGYGHFINASYRTVMSYSNNCASGCTRVPYFSNPNVSYNGFATGIADQRDNARASNITAPDVANFRAAATNAIFSSGYE